MKYLAMFLGVLLVVALIVLVLTFPLMWAINWLFAPQVLLGLFGVAKLTFWKTFVLAFITGALFKSYSTSTKSSE